MKKNLIKILASITCGLGIVATIPFISTSCKKKHPNTWEFDSLEKLFECSGQYSGYPNLVWAQDQQDTNDGTLTINLKNIGFWLSDVDLSKVYYFAGFSFPVSCFTDEPKPADTVKETFTNLPNHEKGVTEIPAGFDMKYMVPNTWDTLTIQISFSKKYSEWKQSLDALKNYKVVVGSTDIITAFNFGVKERKSNKIHMLSLTNKANPYTFNLDLLMNS